VVAHRNNYTPWNLPDVSAWPIVMRGIERFDFRDAADRCIMVTRDRERGCP
jgi:hypothetical protein